jgi:hypothetical protein
MKRLFILSVLTALALPFAGEAGADEAEGPAAMFLSLSPVNRASWISGSIMTMAIYVSLRDKEKGACILRYYKDSADTRQRVIEQLIRSGPPAAHPGHAVLAVLDKTCGIIQASEWPHLAPY